MNDNKVGSKAPNLDLLKDDNKVGSKYLVVMKDEYLDTDTAFIEKLNDESKIRKTRMSLITKLIEEPQNKPCNVYVNKFCNNIFVVHKTDDGKNKIAGILAFTVSYNNTITIDKIIYDCKFGQNRGNDKTLQPFDYIFDTLIQTCEKLKFDKIRGYLIDIPSQFMQTMKNKGFVENYWNFEKKITHKASPQKTRKRNHWSMFN